MLDRSDETHRHHDTRTRSREPLYSYGLLFARSGEDHGHGRREGREYALVRCKGLIRRDRDCGTVEKWWRTHEMESEHLMQKLQEILKEQDAPRALDVKPLVGQVARDFDSSKVRIYPDPSNPNVYFIASLSDVVGDVEGVSVEEAASRKVFSNRLHRMWLAASARVAVHTVTHTSIESLLAPTKDGPSTLACGPFCCPNGFCVTCGGSGCSCSGGCSGGKDPYCSCV